jgi:hypothetical protein
MKMLVLLLSGVILMTTATATTQEQSATIATMLKVTKMGGALDLTANDVINRAQSAGSPVSIVKLNMLPYTQRSTFGWLARLEVQNIDTRKIISAVDIQVDVFDSTRRTHVDKLFLSGEASIKPSKKGSVRAEFTATLPTENVVLFQITKVTYADGSTWSPSVECKATDDLKAIECKAK